MGFIKIPVKGMNDFMPSEMKLREYVIREIKDTYTKFGFNIIETPCLEHIENLCSKQGGENEKLIFKVLLSVLMIVNMASLVISCGNSKNNLKETISTENISSDEYVNEELDNLEREFSGEEN